MEAKDIATIIRACKNAGVTEFKMGEVEIHFESAEEKPVQGGFIDPGTFPMYVAQDEKPEEAIREEIDNSLIAIDDPERWEAMELAALDKQEA